VRSGLPWKACGENAGGRLIGIGIALELVNEGGAAIETESGIARSVEFDGATKIESLAPGAFVGGTICLEQASCRNG
jgi:hypothetical protein